MSSATDTIESESAVTGLTGQAWALHEVGLILAKAHYVVYYCKAPQAEVQLALSRLRGDNAWRQACTGLRKHKRCTRFT